MAVPNLARQPFVNHRPVRRLAAVAWIAAAALLAINVWVYWRHFSSRGEQRSELAQIESRMAEERALVDAALARLQRFDLDWQREQITFLNAKIAERTFSWSALFDHLVEVLPAEVRVERLTPQRDSRSRRRRQRDPRDEVELEITGAAEEAEALLELVDAFFAHERFSRPNLRVESRQGSKNVGFSMSVVYRPDARPPVEAVEAVEVEPEAPAGEQAAPPAGAAPPEEAPVEAAGVRS